MTTLCFIPPPTYPSSSTTAAAYPAPSLPSVHDVLRASLAPSLAPHSTDDPYSTTGFTTSTHPLESRLRLWNSQQTSLRNGLLRRAYGLAEPVKREYEMRLVAGGDWRPAVLGGGAGLHADILAGRDCDFGWEDVFGAGREFRQLPDFHSEMEEKLRMRW